MIPEHATEANIQPVLDHIATEWCFQFIGEGAGVMNITGRYIMAPTFAEACAKLIEQEHWVWNRGTARSKEDYVRHVVQGAVQITEQMPKAKAWDTDLRGMWP